ncbi:MAG: hypothetical protein GTO41_02305, partial [Burkholderiales bacterium]|nr:hypothetical protein [Burkholderiales bacterium]
MRGELGVVRLSRGEYAEALGLLQNQFWADAAYIAERILTVDELIVFVDSGAPVHDRLRPLLARRLARL